MHKLKTAVVSMIVFAAAALCFTACSDDKPKEPEPLSTPEIVLNDDFSVSWAAVENATAYVVNVNGDDLKAQETLTFSALTSVNSYTVKVKAKNDETASDYSAPVTYSVYGVTLPAGEGYSIVGASTVFGGKDYSFTLSITDESYETAALIVKANGTTLTAEGGKYTVQNVSENLNITVEGLEKKTYAVTIPTGEGYTVTGAQTAVYGEDYSFSVAKSVGYDQSTLTVKVNGETIAEENGKYTIANVKNALEITIEGAAKNIYNVTLPSSVAYMLTGEKTITHGETYSFTLSIKDGYDTENLAVKANGTALTAAADEKTYNVENITSALEITIEGLNIKTYTITLTTGEGYTLSGQASAEHGADYTFTLELNEGYSKSSPVVKANGAALAAAEDGKTYTIKNVTATQEITVEGVTINTYKVSIAAGTGFTVTGASETTVEYGTQAQFTIAATNAEDTIKVFNGETAVAGTGNVYTISNVTADITLTVKIYDISSQLLLAENWDDYDGSTKTENTAANSITLRGWQFGISSAYIQKAIEAGYTHLRFDYVTENKSDATKQGVYMEGNGTSYQKCYQGTGSARFDLGTLKNSDGSYAKIWMQGRNSEVWGDAKEISLTMTQPTLFRSTETAKWTKSNAKIYCAVEEDGFIVIDTISCGNDQHVISSAEWWAKYANNTAANNVSQRTMILSGKYLVAGNNTRGAVWGNAGSAVSVIGGIANTEIVTDYMNNLTYTEGNTFYYGLDKEGVYALKVNEFVSNRNSYGGFAYTYVDENTFTVTLPEGGKVVNVNTQDYIAQGYTKVIVTVSEYTSGGQIWVGSGWEDNGKMSGLDSGKSIELALTMFTSDNPYLQIYCANAQTTVTITYTFVK